MSIAIKSQGALLEIEQDPKGSAVWVEVKEVAAIPASGAASPEIPVTHLQSTAQEFLLGLPDNGTIAVTGNYLGNGNDAGQDECLERYEDQAEAAFRVTLADGTIVTFDARVQTFDIGMEVDSKVELNVGLRLTGARTFT